MQTILIFDCFDKQIKIILKNIDGLKIVVITKSILVNADEFENEKKTSVTFFKIFVSENKRLDLIKKIHD